MSICECLKRVFCCIFPGGNGPEGKPILDPEGLLNASVESFKSSYAAVTGGTAQGGGASTPPPGTAARVGFISPDASPIRTVGSPRAQSTPGSDYGGVLGDNLGGTPSPVRIQSAPSPSSPMSL
ncbi:Uncharacterised protein (plasmid) [Legionella adelaidensis]|uniref:Uncharacterized protein n=1 Tax=Legionella adelaidensis TaxID=45056 RepID=A0A0W0R0P9_9GAMM|nr:hypothetical protein [Legionella adelaidensis]KTC64646.1 hypothetical protein Lade_1940 [Legionella adelaidensis]VEH86114.1 Uncharacterised protein [Legionella adelaidensis]